MMRRTLKMAMVASVVVVLSLCQAVPVMAEDSFWDDLKTAGEEFYQEAKKKAPEIYDSAREKMSNAYDYAADKAPEVYEGAKEKAGDAAEAVKAFRQDSEDEFRDWLEGQIGISNNVDLADEIEDPSTEISIGYDDSRAPHCRCS